MAVLGMVQDCLKVEGERNTCTFQMSLLYHIYVVFTSSFVESMQSTQKLLIINCTSSYPERL